MTDRSQDIIWGITKKFNCEKTKWNGKMLVFDCLSQPEGKDWKPTCRKVRMETFMGKALDSALKGVRRKDADE